MQSEPLRTGFVVQDSAGNVYDLPVQLVFPNSSLTEVVRGIIYVNISSGSGGAGAYLLLNQSSAQTVSGGSPEFAGGLTIKSNQPIYLDGA